jgi:hypothetical protein
LKKELDLSRLRYVARLDFGARVVTTQLAELDFTHTATVACDRGRCLSGSAQSRFAEVRGVCETGRFTDHYANSRASVSARAELFNPTLVKNR